MAAERIEMLAGAALLGWTRIATEAGLSFKKSVGLVLLLALLVWGGLGFYFIRVSESSKPEPFPNEAQMGDLRCTLPAQAHPLLMRSFINVSFPPKTGMATERGVLLMMISPGAKSLPRYTLDDYEGRALAGKARFTRTGKDEKSGFEMYEYLNFEGKGRTEKLIFAKDAQARLIMMMVGGIEGQKLRVRREFSARTEIDYLIPYQALENFHAIDSEITGFFEKHCS